MFLCLLSILGSPCGSSAQTNASSLGDYLDSGAARGRSGSEEVLVDRIVAWVDDEAVTLTELEEALDRYQSQGYITDGPETERRMRAALDRWIGETLLYKEAEKQGGEIPSEVVDNRVRAMIEQLERRYGGAEQFEAILSRARHDRDSLREMLRKRVRRELTIARYISDRVHITDEDVAKFRKERREMNLPVEKLHLSQMFFPVSRDALPRRRDEVVQLAHDARRAALGKDSFVGAMKEWAAEHPEADARAGALGTVDVNDLQPALAEAVRKLEPGETSPPIETDRGVHLMHLEGKTTAREILFARRFDETWNKRAEELRRRASVQIIEPILPEK